MSKKMMIQIAQYLNLGAGILAALFFIMSLLGWVSCKVECQQDGGYLLIWLLLSAVFLFTFFAIRSHIKEVDEFIDQLNK